MAREFADPDNWLLIPEFDVTPLDVDFDGFAFLICRGPFAYGDSYSQIITESQARTLLKCARSVVRKSYRTASEMEADLRRLEEAEFCALNQGLADPTPTQSQIAALGYRELIQNLLHVFHARTDPEVALQAMATAGATLGQWLAGDVRQLSATVRKAEPLLNPPRPGRSSKTNYLLAQIAAHPQCGDQELANKILGAAPKVDDGKSPFFYRMGEGFIDRKSDSKISIQQLTGQIAQARSRYRKRSDS